VAVGVPVLKRPLLTSPPEGRENKRKIEKTKTTQAV
jgi:hypothetical protein